MNDEMKQINEAFLELFQSMVSAGYEEYGRALDQIRVELFPQCYSHSHQHNLDHILQSLKKGNNSELSKKLQSIIDSLPDPQ